MQIQEQSNPNNQKDGTKTIKNPYNIVITENIFSINMILKFSELFIVALVLFN